MTGWLFPGDQDTAPRRNVPTGRGHARPKDGDAAPPVPTRPVRGRPAHYFTHDGACYSLDDLKRISGWEAACAAYPGHEIVIVFDSTDPVARMVGLIAVPKPAPGTKPSPRPFFGHGDVMHIRRAREPP